jgi:hypothetical protein
MKMSATTLLIAICAISMRANPSFAMEKQCSIQSAATLTPVIELYTSEGCSSCPPADEWLSTLKKAHAEGKVVAQAFHVNYWDYIGWTDRFAAPAHTTRQREISARSRLNSIYTPQLVRDGLTTKSYEASLASTSPAKAQITLAQTAPNSFEASVAPMDASAAWSAYFTVTEHNHVSKVNAGENRGETLKNDFVVRQYVPLGNYNGPQKLKLSTLAPSPANPRQVNLVVTDRGGRTLQAVSLACS